MIETSARPSARPSVRSVGLPSARPSDRGAPVRPTVRPWGSRPFVRPSDRGAPVRPSVRPWGSRPPVRPPLGLPWRHVGGLKTKIYIKNTDKTSLQLIGRIGGGGKGKTHSLTDSFTASTPKPAGDNGTGGLGLPNQNRKHSGTR